MNELVKTFHIEVGSIIAQLVNFAIVMAVLYIFAYKPILKVLNERSKKIEKGLKDAEEAAKKIKETEEKEKEILKKSQIQASQIVEKAGADGEKVGKEKIEQARQEIERMNIKQKNEIEQERKKMVQEVKNELGNLIMLASGKIVKQTIDEKTHRELIEKAISDLEKEDIKK